MNIISKFPEKQPINRQIKWTDKQTNRLRERERQRELPE